MKMNVIQEPREECEGCASRRDFPRDAAGVPWWTFHGGCGRTNSTRRGAPPSSASSSETRA